MKTLLSSLIVASVLVAGNAFAADKMEAKDAKPKMETKLTCKKGEKIVLGKCVLDKKGDAKADAKGKTDPKMGDKAKVDPKATDKHTK